jgi:hypothetical protein
VKYILTQSSANVIILRYEIEPYIELCENLIIETQYICKNKGQIVDISAQVI